MSPQDRKPGSPPGAEIFSITDSRPNGGAAYTERSIELQRRMRRETEKLLTTPELWDTQVSTIEGVPGILFNVTTSFGPSMSVGGWRITGSRIIDNYRRALQTNDMLIKSMTEHPGVPDDERAKAAVVEATGLAIDMVLKHGGQCATLKYGLQNNFYPPELAAKIPKLIEASRLTGGKSVAIQEGPDPKGEYRKALVQQHAAHIRRYNRKRAEKGEGPHITAPDMQTGVDDMTALYVLDADVASMSEQYGGSENPSPVTALGVFHGMEAMLEFTGKDGNQTTFAIQGGAGEVAADLIRLIRDKYSDADIVISEITEKRKKAEELREKYGVRIVEGNEIFKQGGVFVPSGPSEQLSEEHLTLLSTPNDEGKITEIVLGPANYLFPIGKEEKMSKKYHEARILVAPGALVNQGGIRKISSIEMMNRIGEKPLSIDEINACIADVGPMLTHVLERARDENRTPNDVFREIALDQVAELCVANGLINLASLN